jgi:plastocyanin
VPRLPAALLTLLALVAVGCGSDDAGGGGGGDKPTVLQNGEAIGMKSLKFEPAAVQAKVGQKITWRNEESIPHDVKADSGASFVSSTFGKGGTFSFTPDKAGTIKYECTLHPGMDGTIDVVAR